MSARARPSTVGVHDEGTEDLAEYVKAWWKVVNWADPAARFDTRRRVRGALLLLSLERRATARLSGVATRLECSDPARHWSDPARVWLRTTPTPYGAGSTPGWRRC